jgi:hypothetical protein
MQASPASVIVACSPNYPKHTAALLAALLPTALLPGAASSTCTRNRPTNIQGISSPELLTLQNLTQPAWCLCVEQRFDSCGTTALQQQHCLHMPQVANAAKSLVQVCCMTLVRGMLCKLFHERGIWLLRASTSSSSSSSSRSNQAVPYHAFELPAR